MYYDIFNGDADGIFALHQYRLFMPMQSTTLVTGVKRDIKLLTKITHLFDSTLSIFDISFNSNKESILTLLKQNNLITIFDHHYTGKEIKNILLTTYIDTSSDTCTSLIVNKVIGAKYPYWALCGAYGDNLLHSCAKMASDLRLTRRQRAQLQQLGELFNYNSYGLRLDDLFFHPEQLLEAIRPYANPFSYLEKGKEVSVLASHFSADMKKALQIKEYPSSGNNRVYFLPNELWTRRVTGIFANLKAEEMPTLAHAVVTENDDNTLRISVRAPLGSPLFADRLCKQFPTGGGRSGAAGINNLPKDRLKEFLHSFQSCYSS